MNGRKHPISLSIRVAEADVDLDAVLGGSRLQELEGGQVLGSGRLDVSLRQELVATVHFLLDKAVNNPNAGKTFLFVPKAALVEENGHMHAWVVDPKGLVSRRQVEVVVTADPDEE